MTNSRTITIMLTIDKMIIGGAEQQFLEIIKGLDKTRFKVIAVSLYAGGDLEPEIEKIPDVKYICLNRTGRLDFSALFSMFRIIRQYRVDIVQPFLTPATFFTLLPAILNRTPVKIVTERGNSRPKAGAGYNLYLKLEDLLTRFADWVIPNSVSGKTYVLSRGIDSSRVKVIYNGINIKRLQPDLDKVSAIRSGMKVLDDSHIVGISASLTPNKDHATFLRAASTIVQEIPQTRFAILGNGPLLPELKNQVNKLGIEANVFFLGNQVDIGSYVEAFDISCLCSSEPEGCSNAVLEAMALGKPVVVTNAGGNTELVKDGINGLIVPVQNPEKLAEAIMSCLRQPERAAGMGRHGKAMILKEFSIPTMVKHYEDLYQETLKKKLGTIH